METNPTATVTTTTTASAPAQANWWDNVVAGAGSLLGVFDKGVQVYNGVTGNVTAKDIIAQDTVTPKPVYITAAPSATSPAAAFDKNTLLTMAGVAVGGLVLLMVVRKIMR